MKLTMPFTLKKVLCDDWEAITQEPRSLVVLPPKGASAGSTAESKAETTSTSAKKKGEGKTSTGKAQNSTGPASASKSDDAPDDEPMPLTAHQVLDCFMETRSSLQGCSAAQLTQLQATVDGLRLYFNKALPRVLLYRQEREQYEALSQRYPETEMVDLYGAEHLLRLFVRLPVLLASAAMTQMETKRVQARLSEFLKFMQKNSQELFPPRRYQAAAKVLEELRVKDEEAKPM